MLPELPLINELLHEWYERHLPIVWWQICASYNLSSFRFVEAKRRQNDNYRLFAPKRRQDEKSTTTKLGRKDDKHNPLISALICRLFAWRFVVFSPQKDDRTTRRQKNNCRLFIPKRRQNKKSTIQQNTKRQIQPTNMSSFRLAFCRLFDFSFYRGEKMTIIVLAFCRYFEAKRRQDNNAPSEKTTN
jgi:hypothetical protein